MTSQIEQRQMCSLRGVLIPTIVQRCLRGFVFVRTLLVTAMLFGVLGCESEGGPQLPVKSVKYISMPNDGASIPAPRGMFAATDFDELYVLDNAGRVLVFNGSGEITRQWRMPESEIGRPEGVCRFHDGRVVVADTHYDRLVFFDSDGQVLKLMGQHGDGPGEFVYPVAIAQDNSQNFYVGEYGDKNRIQKFDVDGNYMLEFGSHGEGDGQFQRPSGLVWHEGLVYAVDAFNNRIQIFSDDGKFQGFFGTSDNLPELEYPYDITRCPDGRLFVIEYKSGRLSGFTADGRLIGRYGTSGRGKGQLLNPWGLTAWSNSRLFIADTGNHRIVEIEL
jgi:iron(III) transport system ATP-binding protein